MLNIAYYAAVRILQNNMLIFRIWSSGSWHYVIQWVTTTIFEEHATSYPDDGGSISSETVTI
jgi:hypothetical protein